VIFGSAVRRTFPAKASAGGVTPRSVAAAYSQIVATWMVRWWRFRFDSVTVDRALAAVATLLTQLAIWLGDDATTNRVAGSVVAMGITAPIAFRRRYPTLVGIGVPLLGVVDHAIWDAQSVGYPIATFLALYALAVWTPWRQFVSGSALLALAAFGSSALTSGSLVDTVPWVVVTTAVMLLVRRIVGDRERRAELAERERDVAAREAVLAERSRIARELHDVIAHNVSMMVVQAGAERRLLDSTGGSAREVLEGIERSGRDALVEMRRLVGMLRTDAADALAPQPGLDDLPRLVTQVQAAGLPVELHVDGDRRSIPVGIDLSAYRIVQEALTNCLTHANDAHATVCVRYADDVLELEISDDGDTVDGHESGGGHGLIGIQERAALYGGRFTAGRRPEGGFTVRVLLPIR
jgi:signal transduction histidine kinase